MTQETVKLQEFLSAGSFESSEVVVRVQKKGVIELKGLVAVSKGSLLNLLIDEYVEQNGLQSWTVVRDVTFIPDKMKKNEKLMEMFDPPSLVQRKVNFVARKIKGAVERKQEVVVYTGAGISTAAKIPDFRGPNGVWTCRDSGKSAPRGVPMEQAIPTYSHNALVELYKRGVLSYLVSQNVDGLHRRSGMPAEAISELHGNCYIETCSSCGEEYLRTFDVMNHVGPHFRGVPDTLSKSGISHITGRKCDNCGGMLRDSIIHFSESLPREALKKANEHSYKAKVALVIGSSLQVTPAATLPENCIQNNGTMSIVNLQVTGRDVEALQSGGILIHAKCDDFMELLMKSLTIPFPVTREDEK